MFRNGQLSAKATLLMVGLFAVISCSSLASDVVPARSVLLIVPGLRADDLISLQPLLPVSFYQQIAAGWMVCRAAPLNSSEKTGQRDSSASLLVTLNAGSRALAPSKLSLPAASVNSDSKNGYTLPVNTVFQIYRLNNQLDHRVSLGAMGSSFRSHGQATAAISDGSSSEEAALALLSVMDSSGQVDLAGAQLYRVVPDADAPFGIHSDLHAILSDYDRLPAHVELVSTLFWDLDRADRYADVCLPFASNRHRKAALERLGALIGAIWKRLSARSPSSHNLFLVLSPGPAYSADARDRLAPLLMWGSGISPGLLTSGSTRKPGLIVNTDLLPTLIGFEGGLATSVSVGRPIHTFPDGQNPLSMLAFGALHDRFLGSATLQDVYGGLPTVQLIFVILGMLLSLHCKRLQILAFALSVAVLAMPFGMLVLPAFVPHSIWISGLALAVFTLFIAVSAAYGVRRGWFHSTTAVYLFCACFAGVVLLDLFSGMHLLQNAWMSYSVLEGARYYGIGNEYMGALIGACCILLPPVAHLQIKYPMAIPALSMLYTMIWIAMSLPNLGAKVGAIPSAGCAFGAALLVLYRGRLRAGDMLFVALAVALLIFCFAFFDLRHTAAEQSHLARAFVGKGDGSLPEIALRKLSLECRLVLHSPWSLTMIVAGVSLSQLHSRISKRSQETKAVFAGLGVGSIACLLFNDSGVTAAAMLLLFGWAWAFSEYNDTRYQSHLESKRIPAQLMEAQSNL